MPHEATQALGRGPNHAPPPISNAASAAFGCGYSQLPSLAQPASTTPCRQRGHDAAARDTDRRRLKHS
eukprot:4284185-Alexandrium_andersonii.AAC.1